MTGVTHPCGCDIDGSMRCERHWLATDVERARRASAPYSFALAVPPSLEELRRAEGDAIRRMMLGAHADDSADAFRYATSRMSNAGSYSNAATHAALTLENVRQAQARMLERFGMPMLHMEKPPWALTRDRLEHLIVGFYPQIVDHVLIVERHGVGVYATATSPLYLAQLMATMRDQLPAGLGCRVRQHGSIGALLSRRSKWEIARTATTPYMDRLLERWVAASAQSDEIAMQEMAEHELGRELLVDHDRYLTLQDRRQDPDNWIAAGKW